jgi:small subunit ribosomal protein S10
MESKMSITLRIRLKSYDHQLLDQEAAKIISQVKMDEEDNSRISGPFPLPTSINRWTVLKGPHVNKKSREQFDRRTHHRLIDISSPTSREIEIMKRLVLPAGISVHIKTV